MKLDQYFLKHPGDFFAIVGNLMLCESISQ